MKRILCALLIAALLLPASALAAQKKSKALTETKLPADLKLTLTAGKFESYTQTFTGTWESSDPDVANAEIEVNSGNKKVRIVGYKEGEATLTLTGAKSKKTATVHVTVKADETAQDPVPEIIQEAIDAAIREWEENGGKNLTNEKKTNPYLKWWGAKCEWCGVFATYCLEKAGIPMAAEGDENKTAKLKPGENGAPYSIRVGGVGRFKDAFINMDRATKIPRPGYLVIYGNLPKKGTASNRHHVALVTDVQDRGDGTYQVSTVEGNWDFNNVKIDGKKVKNAVTRFCYIYDPRNVTCANISPVPEEDRTDPDLFHDYTTHVDERPYFVYMFCQTWY